MHIDFIREKIAEKLNDSFDFWSDCLTNTSPLTYGADDLEINATIQNIYVDVPNRKFTFKDVKFKFNVRLNSSGEDGVDKNFFRLVNGEGEFDFAATEKINLKKMRLLTTLDLYSEN